MNRREFHKLAGGSLATLGLGLSVNPGLAALVDKHADDLANGEFNWHPERAKAGPMLIIVSIPDQKVHVYRNGIRVAASTCSTGKPGHSTPTGVFKILAKGQAPPLVNLQQCADAEHEPLDLVGHRPARRAVAGLSGLAWLRAPAAGVLRPALRHHPEGHDRGDRRQLVATRRPLFIPAWCWANMPATSS